MSRTALIELSAGVSPAPLRLPPKDPNPAIYLVTLVGAWREEIESADRTAMISIGAPDAVDASVLRERANEFFLPEFETAARNLVAMAPDAILGELGLTAGDLGEAVLSLASWLGADLTRIARFQRARPGVVPVLECRAQIDRAVARLTRLAPAIRPAASTLLPRTDLQNDLWNLLSAVPQTAKQLAKQLGDEVTDASVRQLIHRLRRRGYTIMTHRGTIGYSRADQN